MPKQFGCYASIFEKHYRFLNRRDMCGHTKKAADMAFLCSRFVVVNKVGENSQE
jgi:hypothetical protein